MAQSIPNQPSTVNSQSKFSSYDKKPQDIVRSTTNNHYLSKLQLRILRFYHDIHLSGVRESDYSLLELAIRFKRLPTTISRALSEMETYGFMGGTSGGCTNKRRWITYEGFSLLDIQSANQIANQNEPIPYIYLSDPESDLVKITKEEPPCEQPNLEKELDTFLDDQRTSYSERIRIKKAIKTTPIGPVRRESVIRRVIAASKKSPITHKLAYFLTAIRKEMEDLKQFVQYVAKSNLSVNRYNLDDLGEIGCYV